MLKKKLLKGTAIIKLRLGRGEHWTMWIKNIMIIILGVYVIKDLLLSLGILIDVTKLYAVIPVLYLSGNYILGYIDEKYGIWKIEASYASKELNPFFRKMDKKIDRLLEKKNG